MELQIQTQKNQTSKKLEKRVKSLNLLQINDLSQTDLLDYIESLPKVKTFEDALMSMAPMIKDCKESKFYVAGKITYLLGKMFNVQNTMSFDQIEFLTEMILEEYPKLRLNEIEFVMKRIARKANFNRIDPNIILTEIQLYRKEALVEFSRLKREAYDHKIKELDKAKGEVIDGESYYTKNPGKRFQLKLIGIRDRARRRNITEPEIKEFIEYKGIKYVEWKNKIKEEWNKTKLSILDIEEKLFYICSASSNLETKEVEFYAVNPTDTQIVNDLLNQKTQLVKTFNPNYYQFLRNKACELILSDG